MTIAGQMKIAELNEYQSIKRQIENFEQRYGVVTYINGVDPSNPTVQSGKTSDTTASAALRLLSLSERVEYTNLLKKKEKIEKYIYSIADEEIKEIFKLKFMQGYSYEKVGEITYQCKSNVVKKVKKYIQAH